MSFEIRWAPQARKDLDDLPAALQVRIIHRVVAAAGDPLRTFRRLSGARVWGLRVGDYRVLADIDLRAERVHVLHVGHRKNVYDR